MKFFFSSVSEIALISSLLAGVITIGADDDPDHMTKINATPNHHNSIHDIDHNNLNDETIIHNNKNNKNNNDPIIEEGPIHLESDDDTSTGSNNNKNSHDNGKKQTNNNHPQNNVEPETSSKSKKKNDDESTINPSKISKSDGDIEKSSSIIQPNEQDGDINSKDDSASQQMNDNSKKAAASPVESSPDHKVESDEVSSNTVPQQSSPKTQTEDEISSSENSNKNKQDEQQKKEKEILVDYASKSVGAVILDRSPSNFKGTSNLLIGDKDRYAITPCHDPDNGEKYVILGLSEDILVKTVKLANYERYSSHIQTFQVLGSQTYPMGEWDNLGTYSSPKGGWGEHTFELVEPGWARYLKFQFLEFHGEEHYCTISQIKVHGSTTLQGFHEMTWGEEEEEEEEEDEEIKTPDDNAIAHHESKLQPDAPSSPSVDQDPSPDNAHRDTSDSSNQKDNDTVTNEGADDSNIDEMITPKEGKEAENEEITETKQSDHSPQKTNNDDTPKQNIDARDPIQKADDKLNYVEKSSSPESSSTDDTVDDTEILQNDSDIENDEEVISDTHGSKNDSPQKDNNDQPQQEIISDQKITEKTNKNKDKLEERSESENEDFEKNSVANPIVTGDPVETSEKSDNNDSSSDDSLHTTSSHPDDTIEIHDKPTEDNYKNNDEWDDNSTSDNKNIHRQQEKIEEKEDLHLKGSDLRESNRGNIATSVVFSDEPTKGEGGGHANGLPSSETSENDSEGSKIDDQEQSEHPNTRVIPSTVKENDYEKKDLSTNNDSKSSHESELGHDITNCNENETSQECQKALRGEASTAKNYEDSKPEEAPSKGTKKGSMLSSKTDVEYDEKSKDLNEHSQSVGETNKLNKDVKTIKDEESIIDDKNENADVKIIETQSNTSSSDQIKKVSSENSYSATMSNVMNGAIKKVTDATSVKGGLKEIRNIIKTSIKPTRSAGSTANEEIKEEKDTNNSPAARTVSSPKIHTKDSHVNTDSSTETDQNSGTSTQPNKKIPVNIHQPQKHSPDNTILSPDVLIELSSRIPSISCLSTLNFSDWKKKSKSGSNTNSNMHTASQPQQASLGGNRNEPIFKKLHDEIKSLQSSQSLYDSYIRALSSCYNQVLNDMTRDYILMEQSQAKRMQSMEDQLSFLVSEFALYRETTGAAYWKKEFNEMIGFIFDGALKPMYQSIRCLIDPVIYHIDRLWNNEKLRLMIQNMIDTIAKYESEAMSFAFGTIFCFIATSLMQWLSRRKRMDTDTKKPKKKSKNRRRKNVVTAGRPQHQHMEVDNNIEIAEATTVVSWDETSDGSGSSVTIHANNASIIG